MCKIQVDNIITIKLLQYNVNYLAKTPMVFICYVKEKLSKTFLFNKKEDSISCTRVKCLTSATKRFWAASTRINTATTIGSTDRL